MEKERPEQTLDELEQEVIDELNLEYSPDENPNKMYSVVFPYRCHRSEERIRHQFQFWSDDDETHWCP